MTRPIPTDKDLASIGSATPGRVLSREDKVRIWESLWLPPDCRFDASRIGANGVPKPLPVKDRISLRGPARTLVDRTFAMHMTAAAPANAGTRKLEALKV